MKNLFNNAQNRQKQIFSNKLNFNLINNFNKKIRNYPHDKIVPKLNKFNIISYNFNSSAAFTSKHLNNIIIILKNFFNALNCIINKPIFINNPNKLIIRICYYQSNTNKDPLSNNTIVGPNFTSKFLGQGGINSINNIKNINKTVLLSYLRDLINLNLLNKGTEQINIISKYSINNSIKNINVIKQKLIKLIQINNILIQNKKILSSRSNTASILTYLVYKNNLDIKLRKRLSINTKKLLIKNNNKKVYLGNKIFISDYNKLNNLLKLLLTSALPKAGGNNYINIQINKLRQLLIKEYKNLIVLIISKYANVALPSASATNYLLKFKNLLNNKNLSKFYIIQLIINNNLICLGLGEALALEAEKNNFTNNPTNLNIKKIKEMFLSFIILLKNKSVSNSTAVGEGGPSINNNLIDNTYNTIALSSPSINLNGSNIIKNNYLKFKYLGILLSKLFNKNVELQLIRLYNIGLDQSILAQTISSNSKKYKLRILLKKLWNKVQINSAKSLLLKRTKLLLNAEQNNNALIRLGQNSNSVKSFISNPIISTKVTGIKIKVAGRLAKERIVPKKTVKTIQVGSLNKNNITFLDSASFTNKNRKGTFNIKVWMSHSIR